MGPGRLHALVDGVFAIAITLLVLNLPQPLDSPHLARALLHQWPSYVAYLVSFVTVGILWIDLHGMMSAVREVNRRFLERTLLFLLFISIIPWPTSIAAPYANHGSQADAAAVSSITEPRSAPAVGVASATRRRQDPLASCDVRDGGLRRCPADPV
jgi:uncharacterized membrane protein